MATSDTELLTEHFGYPPVSLLDDIINSINILAERALNSVEQGLLNAPPASLGFRPPTHVAAKDVNDATAHLPVAEEAHRNEIEAGTHQLETLLCASIDKNFDVFEIYVMRNILCVRPEDRDWIRLSHYEGLDFSGVTTTAATEGDNNNTAKDRPTVESVNMLRRRLQASQKLNCMLHAEKARHAAVLGEIRRLIGGGDQTAQPEIKTEEAETMDVDNDNQHQIPTQSSTTTTTITKPPLAFLQNKGDLVKGDAETPLTTTTAFTLSQLQALRTLSSSLRKFMPDLKPYTPQNEDEEPANQSDEDEDERKPRSWRRQRLEYVETATRKHLENVRGLELGKDGEVRDGGDWSVGGGSGDEVGGTAAPRRLGMGHVEGLEKVVTILGGGSGGGSSQEEEERGQEEGAAAATAAAAGQGESRDNRSQRTGTAERDPGGGEGRGGDEMDLSQ